MCLRFATDSEVFSLSISSLRGIASVPRALPSLAAVGAAAPLISAVTAYFQSLDTTTAAGAEALTTRLGPALELLLRLARSDGAAFHAAGGVAAMLAIATATPPAAAAAARLSSPTKGGAGGGGPSGTAFAAIVASAMTIIERASRARAALDGLLAAGLLTSLLTVATLNLHTAGDAGGGRKWDMLRSAVSKRVLSGSGSSGRRSMGAAASRGSSGGDASASPGGSGGGAAMLAAANAARSASLNAHLEPALRILDRISRSDAGRDALIALSATQRLSGIMVSGSCQCLPPCARRDTAPPPSSAAPRSSS